MSILVSEIFQRTGRLLQDAGAVRWPDASMLDWYNEGLLDMVTRKGSLLPSVETFTCVAGSQQSVPATRIALLEVGRNLGPSAAPANGPIPQVMKREVMDRLVPTWMDESTSATILAVIGSPATPRIFYAYPPQPVNPGRLVLTFSKYPTVVSATSATFELADEHEPVMVEYLLYRAMAEDSENPQLHQLSQMHLQTYLGMLGVTTTQEAQNG